MYLVPVKSTVEILQNFVAFSEYMNFKKRFDWLNFCNVEEKIANIAAPETFILWGI